jgi:hypothetical protein
VNDRDKVVASPLKLADSVDRDNGVSVLFDKKKFGDQIPASAAGKTVGVVMMLSGALYMAMPLAIIGTKFDQAYTEHENEKLLKNKKWAEAQMRRLQNVTRRTRRRRALHLGYQIAEEVGELQEWETVWTPLVCICWLVETGIHLCSILFTFLLFLSLSFFTSFLSSTPNSIIQSCSVRLHRPTTKNSKEKKIKRTC